MATVEIAAAGNSTCSFAGMAGPWESVVRLLRTHYVDPDIEAAKVVFAAVAAHKLKDHPPAWVMAVAPSGSLKTAILDSLQGLPGIHFIDEVTPQTFISGKVDHPEKRRKTPASLLHRIGSDGILIAPDFSTILSMDERSQAKILAQLRRIYDGCFSREFGTDENMQERQWQGRITLLTGATPEVDRRHSVFRSLGERFVQVRWPRAGGLEAGRRAIRKCPEAAIDLKRAVHKLVSPVISQGKIMSPGLPQELEVRLASLTEFVARARTPVPRTRNDHDLEDLPCPEGNTRLPQELAQIARGAAVLAGRGEVDEEDYRLVQRAAMDCIPATRRQVLESLIKGQNAYTSGPASSLVQRTLDDLELVGIVEKDSGHGANLSTISKELLVTARAC